jgi:hypothetical protein
MRIERERRKHDEEGEERKTEQKKAKGIESDKKRREGK